ncbi:MAG: hypothetical protein WBA73_01540 [Devosia sp.]
MTPKTIEAAGVATLTPVAPVGGAPLDQFRPSFQSLLELPFHVCAVAAVVVPSVIAAIDTPAKKASRHFLEETLVNFCPMRPEKAFLRSR